VQRTIADARMDARLSTIRQRMNETGIGYAGIDGLWWLPAVAPFRLPASLAGELAAIGGAIFRLFDAISELYGTPAGAAGGVDQLLAERVPPLFAQQVAGGQVELVRPDFQLVPTGEGVGWRLVATELELCPSAQGFAHAMQRGYGLTTDLADAMAAWLAGRPLLIVGTEQWSEFLFDQLAFCRALAERGVQAHVLFDRPLTTLAQEIRSGARWQPPLFGVDHKPDGWDEDLLGRIRRRHLEPFLWPQDERWPEQVGDAVVFRFGYLDCFAPAAAQQMCKWQRHGATFLNPPTYFLDSKVIMAALNLPVVRQQIRLAAAAALPILDRALPETLLLMHEHLPRLRRERECWVVKFAGFDRGNGAWGGRSLQVGADCSPEEWDRLLAASLRLAWPVVAQRLTPSARMDIGYFDAENKRGRLSQGTTRLRAFLLRSPANEYDAQVGGVHVTITGGSHRVAESTQAVQAPVRFVDSNAGSIPQERRCGWTERSGDAKV
jgi:hypothetical protein